MKNTKKLFAPLMIAGLLFAGGCSSDNATPETVEASTFPINEPVTTMMDESESPGKIIEQTLLGDSDLNTEQVSQMVSSYEKTLEEKKTSEIAVDEWEMSIWFENEENNTEYKYSFTTKMDEFVSVTKTQFE